MSPERVLSDVATRFPDDLDLWHTLETIADGYAAIGAGEFSSVLPELRTPTRGESILIAAERNYVAAICSMELQTASGFAEARDTVAGWLDTNQHETELDVALPALASTDLGAIRTV